MYVSVHLSPQSRGPDEDLEIVDDVVRQALEADAAGCASIGLTEHHLAGYNTYCDPFLLGSHLAAQLRQAYIAITVVQVALQHPVRIAEYCNVLDLLTRGRCLIALAAGSRSTVEWGAFGVDPADGAEMTTQRIDAMLRAWGWREGDTSIDVSTDYDRGVLTSRLMPSSYRRPHPLLARATFTDATVADCARRGWPAILGFWSGGEGDDRRQADLYRETLLASGHDDETIRECLDWLGFLSFVSIAETEREAQRRYDEYLEVGGNGPIAGGGAEPWVEEWTRRQLTRVQGAVIGTPEMIAEHFLSFRTIGVEHARVAFVATSGKREESMESYRLFMEEVVPLLEPQSLPGPPARVPTTTST